MINMTKDDHLKWLRLLVDVALLILFSILKLNYFYQYIMTLLFFKLNHKWIQNVATFDLGFKVVYYFILLGWCYWQIINKPSNPQNQDFFNDGCSKWDLNPKNLFSPFHDLNHHTITSYDDKKWHQKYI